MTPAIVFIVALLPAQTATAGARDVYADWPPLPTFRGWVDYVAWYESRLPKDITCNAAPRWAAITWRDDNGPKWDEIDFRWGRDENDVIPGLLTGWGDERPTFFAWDPASHPDWDRAFLTQRASGLLRDLHEAVQCPYWIEPSRIKFQTRELLQKQLPARLREKPMLFNHLPSGLAEYRKSVQVMLQNAWRAPDGKVNPHIMRESIIDSLKLTHQIDRSGHTTTSLLVSRHARHLIYDTARRALDTEVFGSEDLVELEQWLVANDSRPARVADAIAFELATLYDLLQSAYIPPDGPWPNPPKPNKAILQAHQDLWAPMADYMQEMLDMPAMDMVGEIDRYSPRLAARKLNRLFREVDRILERELPQVAIRLINDKMKTAKASP